MAAAVRIQGNTSVDGQQWQHERESISLSSAKHPGTMETMGKVQDCRGTYISKTISTRGFRCEHRPRSNKKSLGSQH